MRKGPPGRDEARAPQAGGKNKISQKSWKGMGCPGHDKGTLWLEGGRHGHRAR